MNALRGIAIVVLALGAWGCGSSDNSTSGSFSALTYNVAGLPEGLSSSQPALFIPQISPMLNGFDLVLAQEDFAFHDELAADVLHPYQSEPMIPERPMNDGLNRFSQSPFSDFERHTWQECNGIIDSASDCMADKGFSVATHELAPGVFLDIYNLHMDAGGGDADLAARSSQVDQLLGVITTRSVGRAILLAGDTNLKPDQRPVDFDSLERLLEQSDLADACRTLSCPEERIDRFLFRSGDKLALTVSQWHVEPGFVDDQGQDLSDHEAISLMVNWRQ